MKRKKRNPKIIEMSLFNIGKDKKSKIDSKLLKDIQETQKKNREVIEARKITAEHNKRVDALRQSSNKDNIEGGLDKSDSSPTKRLAKEVRRGKEIVKRANQDVLSSSKYDSSISSKLKRIKNINASSYLSNEELLQRIYIMFGVSYDNICNF